MPGRTNPPQRLRIPLRPPQAVPATQALLYAPAGTESTPAVVLAHGAGSSMTAPVLDAVAQGLSAAGHAVLLFNFAYVEAGRRSPDPMPRLQSAYLDAIADASKRLVDGPLVLGGRSLGGRVASHLVADGHPAAGLLFLGYPLHPAGRPERLRVDHWPQLSVPMLFVSGTRDALLDRDLFEANRKLLGGPVDVEWLEGADHGFRVRKDSGRTDADVQAQVIGAAVGWISALQT